MEQEQDTGIPASSMESSMDDMKKAQGGVGPGQEKTGDGYYRIRDHCPHAGQLRYEEVGQLKDCSCR